MIFAFPLTMNDSMPIMTHHSQLKKSLTPLRSTLTDQLELISSHCTQCQTCVSQCAFLASYGDPKKIANSYAPSEKKSFTMPFECSLCELCTAICPHGVNPKEMFLEMRREAFDQGEANLPEHRSLRHFEKRGTSKRFSWYALPEDCNTIFFPGCALSGSRSEITLKTFKQLQKTIPKIGIVLDCCMKPSHDLGDEENFNVMFNEMKTYLLAHGIKTILTACPNCLKVFSEYGTEFESRTIYEDFNLQDLPTPIKSTEVVALHDPCTARFNISAQNAVRDILKRQGLTIAEQEHSKITTLCCGEGGAASCISPLLAENWGRKRVEATQGQQIVSYCAGCTQTLGKKTRTSHILDLIFAQDYALNGQVKVTKAPLTYLKRLKLKKYLQRHLQVATSRERTFQSPPKQTERVTKKITQKTLLIGSFLMTSLILVLKAWTH